MEKFVEQDCGKSGVNNPRQDYPAEKISDGKPSVEQRKEHIVQKAIYQFTYCDQPQWKQVIFAVKNFCRISVEIPDDHVQNREDPKIIPDTKIHQKPGKKACQYTRVLPLKKGCRNNEDQQNIRYHVRHLKIWEYRVLQKITEYDFQKNNNTTKHYVTSIRIHFPFFLLIA